LKVNLNTWLEQKRHQVNCGGILSYSFSKVCSICQDYCFEQNSLHFSQKNSFGIPCYYLNLPYGATFKWLLSSILSPSDPTAMRKELNPQLLVKVQKYFKVCSTEIFILATPTEVEDRMLECIYRISREIEISLILAGTPKLLSTINSRRIRRSRDDWDHYWID